MAFTTIKDLNTELATWLETNIVQSRMTGDRTRQWCVDALSFSGSMDQAGLRTVVDKTELNTVYATAYQSNNPNEKKDFVLTKVEIALLYSFLKCFVMRHKTRIMCYRDDLSQKGARNMYTVGLSENFLDQLRQTLQGGN